jgi:hypothetical protein
MANVKISILTEFLGKGLKDADKSVKGLESSVKKLGYLFGGGYLGAKVLSFAKSSTKAFLDDEKAVKKLNNVINNLGLSLSAQSLNNYVERLSLATGVVDDQLRPALQALLQVTGSVTQSQKLLAQAVDVSAGSTEDLLTVANDLAQAYVGNTRGLRKYNLGFTKAELAAASFVDIQERINQIFGGANAAYLTTYAGKTQRLTTAFGEFKEKVGKGLVAALLGEKGKPDSGLFLTLMEKAGDGIERLGVRVGKNLQLMSLLITGKIDEFNRLNGPQNYVSGTVGSALQQGAVIQAKAAQALADKREKERLALAAQTTAEKKNQLALDKARLAVTKAAANYDITKITLAAALRGKVSEEEKRRILDLQKIEEIKDAIAEENGQKALRLVAELDAARAKAAKDELERQKLSYEDTMAKIMALNAAIAARQAYLLTIGMGAAVAASGSVSASVAGASMGGGAGYELPSNPYAGTYYGATGRDPMPISVNVNIDGQTVANALVNTSNSGTSSSSARSTGSFA